jgi:hypothetical protein
MDTSFGNSNPEGRGQSACISNVASDGSPMRVLRSVFAGNEARLRAAVMVSGWMELLIDGCSSIDNWSEISGIAVTAEVSDA